MKETNNKFWTARTIYDRILVRCEQCGWTVTTLGKESGITPSTLYTYQYRDSMPSIETLILICDAFGITLSQFFQTEEEETDELWQVLNALPESSKILLEEVAKRMLK